MKKTIAILASVLIIAGCGSAIDENEAIKALNNAGYSNVRVIENHWASPALFGCSESDEAAFECTAINQNGKHVKVTVCSNFMFKKSTIRH